MKWLLEPQFAIENTATTSQFLPFTLNYVNLTCKAVHKLKQGKNDWKKSPKDYSHVIIVIFAAKESNLIFESPKSDLEWLRYENFSS